LTIKTTHHLSSPAIPPPPTVYATFGSKAAIVGEIVGGLEAEADRDRWGARIQAEPDPLLKLGLYANGRDAWAAAVTDKVATPCESSSSARASALALAQALRAAGTDVAVHDRDPRAEATGGYSADLPAALGDERFDVVVDAVGGAVRTHSLDLLAPGGRLVVGGNASGDWAHQVDSNQLWLRNIAVTGFTAGAYLPAHPEVVRPALVAALEAVAAGLGETEVDVLPFTEAVIAHERVESRDLNGRVVLSAFTPR